MANIILRHLETTLFDNCPQSCKALFYRLYLDDTFVIFENESQVERFLVYINSLHANINFTVEKESGCKLSLHDVRVERSDSTFDLSVYRKPTHTNLRLSCFFICTNST